MQLKPKKIRPSRGLSHGTHNYICMYKNAIANNVTLKLYTLRNFITYFLKWNINFM